MHDVVEAAAKRHRPYGVFRGQWKAEPAPVPRRVEHIAEEGRQHGRRTLGPGEHAGEAQRNAVDQPGARVIGDQIFIDQLVRPVAPARRRQGLVVDHLREGRAEDADGA